jgi:hypothetical protein
MVVFEDILSGDGLERAFLSQEGVVNLEEQVGKRIPLLERRRGVKYKWFKDTGGSRSPTK